MARHAALVAAVRRELRKATGRPVTLIQTHISSVLLAGEYAYKLKKPVAYGFVDFSTLAARSRCCEEELRLNRRTAPQIYLDVLRITGTESAPRLGGRGPAIEYAVRMRRFATRNLADRRARAGRLGAGTSTGWPKGWRPFMPRLRPRRPVPATARRRRCCAGRARTSRCACCGSMTSRGARGCRSWRSGPRTSSAPAPAGLRRGRLPASSASATATCTWPTSCCSRRCRCRSTASSSTRSCASSTSPATSPSPSWT
jgi:hypothetical protein